jgi:RNA polymerase sigma-70 factor (ECF subfamily)
VATVALASSTPDPEREAVLGDALARAMLVVLEILSPPERLAFVLHDMFALPFGDIAPIVGKSTLATRQLASRARRRVQAAHGGERAVPSTRESNEDVVRAFMEATRGGDFARLLTLLDPEVVLRADAVAVAMGTKPETLGAHDVAEFLSGRARAARLALLDGEPGAVWFEGRNPRVAFVFTVVEGQVTGIELVADTERLEKMTVEPLRWIRD